MSWQAGELGDFLTLKRGHDLPNGSRKAGDVPVVSSSGFTGWHNEAKAEPPGVVTGRYGTIGEVFYVDQPYWPLNTALYVIDFKSNDPKFIAYFLREKLKNYQSDKAAVPGVDRKVLHKLPAQCPDTQIQQSIVRILSAYDDLIENNRRRIALLEEAARQLYKEWFVRFRFPGHEHVKIIDGVPEGWEMRPFDSLADFLNGFAFKPYHLGEIGLPIVKIPELKGGILGKTPRYDGEDVPNKYVLATGDLIFSWSGTLAVDFWCDGPGYLNQHLFKVTPYEGISAAYLLVAIRWAMVLFENQTVGATMKHIRRSALSEVKIPVPPAALYSSFRDSIDPLYKQVINLRQLSRNAAKARDLLLPKLMSGAIAV